MPEDTSAEENGNGGGMDVTITQGVPRMLVEIVHPEFNASIPGTDEEYAVGDQVWMDGPVAQSYMATGHVRFVDMEAPE